MPRDAVSEQYRLGRLRAQRDFHFGFGDRLRSVALYFYYGVRLNDAALDGSFGTLRASIWQLWR